MLLDVLAFVGGVLSMGNGARLKTARPESSSLTLAWRSSHLRLAY